MAKRTHAWSEDDRDAAQSPIRTREALRLVRLARQYIAEITDRQPVQITAVAPTDQGGWIVEVEIVEDQRIPPSADILALFDLELDAHGELLAYRRTRRYRRGQALSPMRGAEKPAEPVVDGHVLAAELTSQHADRR